jgi:carboxymethylenebutenolidase
MFPVQQSQLIFESSGHEIQMDCFAPQANGQRFPAVIGLHGSGGGYPVVAVPARLLAAQGFAVYVPHYFQRTGTEWVSDRGMMIRHAPAWMKTVWDAVSFVARQPHTDPDRIALLGFSLGAYLSLGLSTIDDRVKAVVDFFGGFPKEMKLFMRRLCPVLILHGDADDTVPVSEALYLKDLLEKKRVPYELKIYPGVGHGFGPDIMTDAAHRTLAFLRRYLAGGSTSGTSARFST